MLIIKEKNFEEICFDILKYHVKKIQLHPRSNINNFIFEPDAIVTDTFGKKAIIEIKMYRNFSVNLGLIESALEKLQKNSFIFNISNMVLIISAKLDSYYKKSFEQDYGVSIIDIENLLFLSNEMPEIKSRLIELLGIKSDNENDIKGIYFEFNKIFGLQTAQYTELVTSKGTELSKGELLYKEIKDIKPGKRAFSEYEKKCTDILRYLFEDSLDGWHIQHSTNDGLNRFDLICRIKATDGIWSFFINDFKSRYLLFEFKNYSEMISQTQIYTTEKYLFAKALRNVAIIISRNGASRNAKLASDGVLKESGKVILNISDDGLQEMLRMKDSGSDPTDYLFDLLDEKLLKLSK